MIRTISIIGSGNVATNLSKAILLNNFTIVEVYSKNIKNAILLANKLNAHVCKNIEHLMSVDLICIAVSDDKILNIVKQIDSNFFVIHTSGSISIDIFKNKFKKFGVIYPLQTLTKDVEIDFKNVPLLIEANNKIANDELLYIANSISNTVIKISSKQRKHAHLSAVICNNFSHYLIRKAFEYAKQNDIDISIFFPLLDETIRKIKIDYSLKSQTGPAMRKDIYTIEKHIEMLEQFSDLKNLYSMFSNQIIKEVD